MLEVTLLDDEKIAVLRPVPPLTAGDFENAARVLDPGIERLGPLNGVMIVAPSFPGWDDFRAFASHLRFVRDHHRQVARVAIVSDSSAFKALPAVAGLFVQAEVRHFRPDAEDKARQWLATPVSASPGLKFHRSDDPPLMWIEIDGKIGSERYREMKREMEAMLANQNGGNFLVRFKHFQGIEPLALLEDLKFGLGHLKQFKRIAIIGDAPWLDRSARLANLLIPGEIRAFPENREEKAWDWIKA